MNIEYTRLSAQDVDRFLALVRLFEDVFEMKPCLPPRSHLQKLLEKTDFLVFVAMKDNEVVGGLTTYVLTQYYSEGPVAYLFDLAVKRNFQRMGIGKKLIAGLNAYCREQGFEEVFVQADKADDYAIDFYRKTGITNEEAVVHFYYTL